MKPTRNPNWTGPVYSEQFADNENHTFKSVYEFQCFVEQEAAMDQFLEKPEFVWAAKPMRPSYIDFQDLHYLMTCNPGTAKPRFVKKVQAVIKEFNDANARSAFGPDKSIMVPLQWTNQPAKGPVTPPPDAPEGE